MWKNLVTTVIPVKETGSIMPFFAGNINLLINCLTVVIDSGGGEKFKDFATIYIARKACLAEARKLGFEKVETPYTLNLDMNNVLPFDYLKMALMQHRDPKVAVVAIDYEECLGHYGFGTSLWKTGILKELYDYNEHDAGNLCECQYMWRKVLRAGFKIQTLPQRAKNLGGARTK